ncbi:Cycloeucalenol cycloisomerase [Abeliophyllum distichum]|uniref:Cycloeucalenol cycloisomerase n=1 Tax=Abeliophyllum distichum TaxID=126358 RepID=A0ABD1VU80_9LAMI
MRILLSQLKKGNLSCQHPNCRKKWESFTEWEYLFLGLFSALPTFIIPMLLVGKADSSICWKDRYWVKANIWIIVFSYVGNYFWTHYFFTVLGASYTFPSWKMNNVPHTTFLLTHVCFLFYHVSSNMTLRRLQHSIDHLPEKTQWLFKAAWILAFSYFMAYLETLAISNFSYYEFLPNVLRIDEKPGNQWDLPRVAIDALGAAMLVTIILDWWRIFLGPVVPVPDSKQCLQPGLPWFPRNP